MLSETNTTSTICGQVCPVLALALSSSMRLWRSSNTSTLSSRIRPNRWILLTSARPIPKTNGTHEGKNAFKIIQMQTSVIIRSCPAENQLRHVIFTAVLSSPALWLVPDLPGRNSAVTFVGIFPFRFQSWTVWTSEDLVIGFSYVTQYRSIYKTLLKPDMALRSSSLRHPCGNLWLQLVVAETLPAKDGPRRWSVHSLLAWRWLGPRSMPIWSRSIEIRWDMLR